MNGSWHILSAMGFSLIYSQLKNRIIKWIVVGLILLGFGMQMYPYLKFLYGDYSKKYAIEWQYGMKQIVGYLNKQKHVSEVYMTIERCQPHIFFLYYLGTNVNDYLNSREVNQGPKSGCSGINSFGKYHFGNWDSVQSQPAYGVFYVLTPSEYNGLAQRNSFSLAKTVYYPDGSDAYYIVTSW
jgi:hypothetical protein